MVNGLNASSQLQTGEQPLSSDMVFDNLYYHIQSTSQLLVILILRPKELGTFIELIPFVKLWSHTSRGPGPFHSSIQFLTSSRKVFGPRPVRRAVAIVTNRM